LHLVGDLFEFYDMYYYFMYRPAYDD